MLTRFASFSFTDRRSVICRLTQQLSSFTGPYYCPILSVAPAIRTQIYMYIYVSDSTTLSLQSFTASLNSVHYLQKGRTIFLSSQLCYTMYSYAISFIPRFPHGKARRQLIRQIVHSFILPLSPLHHIFPVLVLDLLAKQGVRSFLLHCFFPLFLSLSSF